MDGEGGMSRSGNYRESGPCRKVELGEDAISCGITLDLAIMVENVGLDVEVGERKVETRGALLLFC